MGLSKGAGDEGNPQQDLKNKGVIDSECSRHMTWGGKGRGEEGNRLYLTDYEEIDGGFVAFGGNSKGEKITKKGKIRTGKLDFEDVYFVKELKFNLVSVSQMCDKNNSVLFTDTECVVLSPYFKLTDESHVLLKVPRKDNMYSVDLRMVILKEVSLSLCQAHQIESNLCIELDHVNFKTMNKLVRGNLVRGRKPALSFMRPFGCPVTILNTIDHLGKFDGKADEGFFVGYSTNSKAFRVFNSRTRIVEENLHVQFSENTPNIAGSGPNWLFDIDALTKSMNYKPVVAGNQSNGNAGTKACDDAGKARMETLPGKDYILLPMWPTDPLFSHNLKDSPDAGFKPSGEEERRMLKNPGNENDDEDVGAEADMNNLNAFMPVIPIPTTRIHKDHPVEQIIRDLHSAPQTRRMTKNFEEHGLFSSVQQRINHKDFQNCLFACFLSQEEPKKMDVKSAFLYVQVYVDDIIFGSTKKSLCTEFEKMVHKKFQMSSIGELTFFLGLQVKHKEDGIFINQDNDYAEASIDRKSTIEGCQFIWCRLISWQCKKQTVIANSTTEAEYIAASNCRGQVLWIQNQLLDYGYNFMQTKIHIDNKSAICIVKNPVFHSKTKHIEIRHHFIRDSYEKKLIQMIKIHTDQNVADLLTKAFDVSRFQYLIASIGMLNL
ncbi:putative ribonuclease H-like domain-containing protein [Tanacetum coccineum]